MTLQLIGTKNNQETRKAERFLKERGLAYQFVDLGQRALSRGELESVARHAGLSNIMDTESREYISRGLSYMEFDPAEELTLHPGLLKQPLLRHNKGVLVGFVEETWKKTLLEA